MSGDNNGSGQHTKLGTSTKVPPNACVRKLCSERLGNCLLADKLNRRFQDHSQLACMLITGDSEEVDSETLFLLISAIIPVCYMLISTFGFPRD